MKNRCGFESHPHPVVQCKCKMLHLHFFVKPQIEIFSIQNKTCRKNEIGVILVYIIFFGGLKYEVYFECN